MNKKLEAECVKMLDGIYDHKGAPFTIFDGMELFRRIHTEARKELIAEIEHQVQIMKWGDTDPDMKQILIKFLTHLRDEGRE